MQRPTPKFENERKQKRTIFHAALIALSVVVGAAHAEEWPQISLSPHVTGLTGPVHITHAGDGRLFIVELAGRIRVVENGILKPTPFLDITNRTGGNQGLLSVAFPPNFATDGHFYVNYTEKETFKVIISRFSPDSTAPGQFIEQKVLEIPHDFPVKERIYHSGGELAFGSDGFLYIGIGDNHDGEINSFQILAQDLRSLRGKILRLDVETGRPTKYTIPETNPFLNQTDALPEIWARGVRNPWRSSFDRMTNEFYIADVGGSAFEEINVQPAGIGGQNYGWPIMEGPDCGCNSDGMTLPAGGYANARAAGECMITGGTVYRGTKYPRMNGIYFYADFCSGKIWGVRRQGGTSGLGEPRLLVNPPVTTTSADLVSIGQDAAGDIYAIGMTLGVIYKLTDSVTNTAPVASSKQAATNEDTPVALTLTASDAENYPLSFSIVSGPSNGQLSGSPPNLSYKPNPNYSGSDGFVFKANDGTTDSNHATVSILVSPVNDAPIAVNDSAKTKKNTQVSVPVLANDRDVDGDALKIVSCSTPPNATTAINAAGTAIEVTPARNATGTISFTYTVRDPAGATASATVKVTIGGK